MKLQQLRYIWEVARHNLNVSATAERLYTSQPGISKQIRLLEDELGVPIFARNGKNLTELTPAGKAIIRLAGDIMEKSQDIRNVADEFRDQKKGALSIATTHTQARYALPSIVKAFMQRYPGVSLNLHQGTPMQISELASKGVADLAIATEALDLFDNLVMFPCYRWNRCVLVLKDHPLVDSQELTLKEVAKYPIITYVFGFTGRSRLDEAFSQENLQPDVVLTAVDADVIKTYVRLGLGIGIIANMAYDPQTDNDLVALDASHLFGTSTTSVGLRKETFLRSFVYEFIEGLAPHLNKEMVQKVMKIRDKKEREELFSGLEIPTH